MPDRITHTLKASSVTMCILFTVLLTGCASHPQDSLKVAEKASGKDDVCGQLAYIFNNSSDGFQAIRTQPNYQNKITLWQSTYQPLNVHCEIWQWSNRYSYVCSKVLPDEQSAEAIYKEANTVIQQCVSDGQATSHENKLPDNKGLKTEYRLNDQVRGSTQLVNTSGLLSNDWTVYVLISSPGDSLQGQP